MNKVEINVPEGYEIDKDKSSFETGVVFFKKKKEELPSSWEELGEVSGAWIDSGSSIFITKNTNIRGCHDKNVWPSKEEAEAALALSQLLQLRDRYNGDWKADWRSHEEIKYAIRCHEGKAVTGYTWGIQRPLNFKTAELRDKFLENFRDLIETAKPLL